jgi:hypothetical protein
MVAIARARARSSKLLVAALLVALSVLALASAAPASPTTPILDDFNRGLEDPLTQWENWEPQSIDGSGPTLEALGGGAGVDEGDVHADSYRTEPLPPDDAEVYGTIGVNPSDQRSMYLYLNIQDAGTPGFDAYEARWFHWVSGDGFYLRKITNGGTPQNFFGSPLQVWDAEEPSAGDMLLLRRVGSQLQFWHRNAGTWVLRLTANDSQFMGGSARTRTSSSATSSREAVSPASWTSQVRSGTSSSAAQARSTTTTTSRPHRVAAEKSCFRSSPAAAQAQQSKRHASYARDVERQRCQITSALVRTRASRFLRTAASRQRTSSEKSTN